MGGPGQPAGLTTDGTPRHAIQPAAPATAHPPRHGGTSPGPGPASGGYPVSGGTGGRWTGSSRASGLRSVRPSGAGVGGQPHQAGWPGGRIAGGGAAAPPLRRLAAGVAHHAVAALRHDRGARRTNRSRRPRRRGPAGRRTAHPQGAGRRRARRAHAAVRGVRELREPH